MYYTANVKRLFIRCMDKYQIKRQPNICGEKVRHLSFVNPFLLATGCSVVGAGGRSPIVGSVWTRVFIDRPEDGGRDRGLPSREPNTCGALRNIHQGKNCYDNLCNCYVESSRNLHRTNIYCQTIEIDLTRLLVL